jgi:hypothetical protein
VDVAPFVRYVGSLSSAHREEPPARSRQASTHSDILWSCSGSLHEGGERQARSVRRPDGDALLRLVGHEGIALQRVRCRLYSRFATCRLCPGRLARKSGMSPTRRKHRPATVRPETEMGIARWPASAGQPPAFRREGPRRHSPRAWSAKNVAHRKESLRHRDAFESLFNLQEPTGPREILSATLSDKPRMGFAVAAPPEQRLAVLELHRPSAAAAGPAFGSGCRRAR